MVHVISSFRRGYALCAIAVCSIYALAHGQGQNYIPPGTYDFAISYIHSYDPPVSNVQPVRMIVGNPNPTTGVQNLTFQGLNGPINTSFRYRIRTSAGDLFLIAENTQQTVSGAIEWFEAEIGTYLFQEFSSRTQPPMRFTVGTPAMQTKIVIPQQCNNTDRSLVHRTWITDSNGRIVEQWVGIAGPGGCADSVIYYSDAAGFVGNREWREMDGSPAVDGPGNSLGINGNPTSDIPQPGDPSSGGFARYTPAEGFDLEKWKSEQYAAQRWDAGSYIDEDERTPIGVELDPVAKIREHNDEVRHRESIEVTGDVVRAIRENTVSTGARLDRVEVAIGGIEIEGGSGGGGGDTDVSGVEERLDTIIAMDEARDLRHEEAASGEADLPLSAGEIEAAASAQRSAMEGAFGAYAPEAGSPAVPGGKAGAWMIDTGIFGSFDVNPMNHPDIASAADLVRTLLAWLIFVGYAYWCFDQLGQVTGEVMVTPQARGNPVFAGTGAQVTGLVAATIIISLCLLLPALWATHIASNYGTLSIFSVSNPISDGGGIAMSDAVAMGWYLVCQFVPVELVFWVATTTVTARFWLVTATRGVQAAIKIVVP